MIPNVQTMSEIRALRRSETPPVERMTARVIEVGEVTAGIAVPEHGGVRFYSSAQPFDGLDGQLFRSFELANRAARERTRSLAAAAYRAAVAGGLTTKPRRFGARDTKRQPHR